MFIFARPHTDKSPVVIRIFGRAVLRLCHTQRTNAGQKERRGQDSTRPRRRRTPTGGVKSVQNTNRGLPSMFVDNHNRAGHAKPQQCTVARMVAHEKTTAPGRRQNKAAPARAVLLPRVVSPPRRMLHTDAAAVWRLTDTSRRYNTPGVGERGQYGHTDKSPARMGAPRVEAIPYAPPQIWTTWTIRTTSERERPAPYRTARGKRPKASTLQKGAKHHPPERNTRGGGGLFCSSQKKANRRGKGKRAGAGV